MSVEQPDADRDVEIAGNPIKMSRTPPKPRGRAPLLDEHRDEVFDDASVRSDAGSIVED